MSLLDVVILSIVEGFTEFLPVSSTGHLIIVSHLLGIDPTSFSVSFKIAIQLGAVLAIVLLYWRSLFLSRAVIYRLALAFLPTAVIGFLFFDFIKGVLLESELVVVIMFFVGGLALIGFELWHTERPEAVEDIANLSPRRAFVIGLFQSVAFVPGVSRAAATIIGGLWLGMKRRTILEFSFLLAVPTMGAATAYDLIKNAPTLTGGDLGLIILGAVLSFVFALLAVKFLLVYINHYSFIPFGVYRIILAVILFFILII